MPAFPIHVDSASPFPIGNLPFGIFSTGESKHPRACTAIGDFVLDLALLESCGAFEGLLERSAPVFNKPSLNHFAALSKDARRKVREGIASMLNDSSSLLFSDHSVNDGAFIEREKAQMHLPMDIPEFTDYSCFEEHVANAAVMTGTKVPASFYCFPLAYNGRVSSLISSNTNIRRPRGVYKKGDERPEYQATAKLDYELEMGVIVSKPVAWGSTVSADEAFDEHVFGYVLVNDWSARDIQGFEMMPLGPFNGKAFATSIGAWIVVPEALQHAETKAVEQRVEDLPSHLRHQSANVVTYDIDVRCSLARNGGESKLVSHTNFAHSYFTVGQMLAHRACSGCGLRTGELVATGTISSPESSRPDAELSHKGCLWEMTQNGKLEVPNVGGDFLEDGDVVTFEASAKGADGGRIGFGSVVTKILPADAA